MSAAMEYIRRTYNVPAHAGVRVRYTGSKEPRMGTIKSADGGYINILLDGDRNTTGPYHPTWMLEYQPNEVKQ